MGFSQIFSIILILIQIWHSEMATIDVNMRLANRKQKKFIEGSMDLGKNPCNNFYEFACGNWDKVFVEAGSQYFEPITLLDYKVNKELSYVFDRFTLKGKPKFIQEAYKYYKSCRNIENYEFNDYLMWLKTNEQFEWIDLFGVSTAKKRTEYNWLKTLAIFSRYGLNDVFIQQIIKQSTNDLNKFIMDLNKPTKEGGFKPLTFVEFEFLLLSLSAKTSDKAIEELWLKIEEFEKKLQDLDKIEDIPEDNDNLHLKDNSINFKDLPFEWLKDYVKIIMNKTDINPRMPLYIQNIAYFKALNVLLKTQSQQFLYKYLEIRFLWHLYKVGPINFSDIDCLANTRSLMPTAMHWLYEQQHPELFKEYDSISKMFNNIRQHFNNTIIKNNHKFNKTTVKLLQNKINTMKLKLNNIPRDETLKTLEKFYEPLNFNTNKFYQNHLQLLRQNFQARLALLAGKDSILHFTYLENEDTGSSSSAYYWEAVNTVYVPLTLLQPPIYSPGLDDIYKYSSLGFLLAHEMFHGFDATNLWAIDNNRMILLELEENRLYNSSYNCMLKINPSVIREKIADINGLYYAYKAFFDAYTDDVLKAHSIHGHDISLNKLYFLNFAQFFCGNAMSEVYEEMIDHGADDDRVTDALKQFPEFSKVFQCTRNDKLYPRETCGLWR